MNSQELFKSGLNCSQSVFLPFATAKNIDKDTALKVMSPFGGGLAKTDNMCGAVSGAIAAIGLHFGHTGPDNFEAKAKCAEVTREFLKKFKDEFGSIQCTELIGYNLSSKSENQKASEAKAFETHCPKFVDFTQKLVAELTEE